MSQSNNDAMFQIFNDDDEQIYNDNVVVQSAMNLNENQRTNQMNRFSSHSSFEISKNISPLRPLTAYNIFFQLQRERIMNSDEYSKEKFTESDIIDVIQERYKNLAVISSTEKRNKYHGNTNFRKISFKELASKISTKWKETDTETKSLLQLHANKELDDYSKVTMVEEVELNRPASLNSDISYDSKIQASSDGYRRQNLNPVAFPSFSHNNQKVSRGTYEAFSKNDNTLKRDEDKWNRYLSTTDLQPKLVEIDKTLQCSESASNSSGVNDITNPIILHDTNHYGIESSSRNILWQNYMRQNLAYKEARLKYHYRQLRIMYRQLQLMTNMRYNMFPANNQLLSEDVDYYQSQLDNDDEKNIDNADELFLEPNEIIYPDNENNSSSLTVQENESFQIKPFPNVSMNSFDNINENVFDQDDNGDHDFSIE